MQNVIAGVLIGVGNTSWTTVLGTSVGWGVAWIVWSYFRKSPRLVAQVAKGKMIKGWGQTKALAAAFFVEFVTAFLTALPIGSITFLIKEWIS